MSTRYRQGLMRGGGTHDGVIYALPQEEGTVVWAWNLAVLDELGVGPPQTDTEFVEMCKLAAEKGIIVDPGWGFLSNWATIGLFKSQNTWSVAEDESGTTVSNVSDPAFTDAINVVLGFGQRPRMLSSEPDRRNPDDGRRSQSGVEGQQEA